MADCREEGSANKEDGVAKENNGSNGNDDDGESERKEKLIGEILELQNTLHDLSQRVHNVKEECESLQTDNQVRCSCYHYHSNARLL